MSTPNDRGTTTGNGKRPPVSIELNGSEQESDDVTELFLGEGSVVPASMPAYPKAKALAEPLNKFKIVGLPQESEEDPEEPALAAETTAFDALEHSPAIPAQIEAIVQGHLPVFASAWVTQYAKTRADELKRAVVLIRMRQGFSSIECILPTGTPSMSMAPAESLETAIETARGMGARHWIIQTDEVNEPSLWRMQDIGRITILTGADRIAVTACSKVIKSISQVIHPDGAVEIHVAVMGSTPEGAREAIDLLKSFGQQILGREIGGTAPAAKIGAGTASSLYQSSDDPTSIETVIETIDVSVDPSHATPISVNSEQATQPTSRAASVDREMEAMRASLLQSASKSAHAAAASTIDDVVRGNANEESSATGNVGPSLGVEPQSLRPASLIEFIDDVEPLGFECPTARGVEFGIAPDGRMHLIAHIDGELNSGHPSTQSRAVEDLVVASAWAASHARLLLSANPHLRLDGTGHAPILHVITNKPREARRLLDTHIRVHLVVPPQDNRWISMELN